MAIIIPLYPFPEKKYERTWQSSLKSYFFILNTVFALLRRVTSISFPLLVWTGHMDRSAEEFWRAEILQYSRQLALSVQPPDTVTE